MPEAKDLEAIKKEIRTMVAKIAETSEENIKDDANFVEDLGVDSMMALEIVAAVEKKYKIPIPEEEIPKIQSLTSVFELIEKSLKK